MISSNRWINVGALTVILVMVWASSLWAPYHRFDYSQWDRVMNLNTKVIELMKKGKYQEAVEPAEKVLRLTKQIYLDDPDNDNVEVMMQNLAWVYLELGRYDEAELLFKQILKTDEALVGPNDPEVARSLINLAALYSAQGQYDKAEPLQKRALAIYEKTFGPNYPKVAALRLGKAATPFNKGVDYAKKGQYGAAIASYKEAIRLKPDYAKAHNKLGWAYYKNSQYDKAEPHYKRALAIREKTLGPDHRRVANVLKNMAKLYREMGRDDEAKKMLVRAKRSALGISKSSEKIGKMTPTELIQVVEEKEGIQFKIIMTSGVEDKIPIDFRTTFSINDDDKMYVFVHWWDMVGDHRVTVIWSAPDQEIFAFNIYDVTVKGPDWKTWQSQKIFKNIPTGVWTFELYLDGKPLVAKKFTVTPNKVDETKKLLVRAKPSARGISKSSEKIGEITPTDLIQVMEEKEGIQFKAVMTPGVKNKKPVEVKTTFSVNDDGKIYVYVYWRDIPGEHTVRVYWLMPSEDVWDQSVYTTTFKTENWRTWHWKKMYKAMPKGDWTFALLLDGKHLVTKKFTVTD